MKITALWCISRVVARLSAIGALFLMLVASAGCGGAAQWEITFENRNDAPTSCFITMGGGGTVKVDDVTKGFSHALIVGSKPIVVESVKVVRGSDEQTLTPRLELRAGKRYAIIVEADGRVAASISDR